MLYTALYFENQFHHGRLLAISQTIPKGFRVDGRLDFLAPSKSLLADWKAENITQEQYIERYRAQIRESWQEVKEWLDSLSSKSDVTLLCWEKKESFCHRNLIAKLIKKHRPECFGGTDVMRVEMDFCNHCGNKLIPGLDSSFCIHCRIWFSQRCQMSA